MVIASSCLLFIPETVILPVTLPMTTVSMNGWATFCLSFSKKTLDKLKYSDFYKSNSFSASICAENGTRLIVPILEIHQCAKPCWAKSKAKEANILYYSQSKELYGLEEESVRAKRRVQVCKDTRGTFGMLVGSFFAYGKLGVHFQCVERAYDEYLVM